MGPALPVTSRPSSQTGDAAPGGGESTLAPATSSDCWPTAACQTFRLPCSLGKECACHPQARGRSECTGFVTGPGDGLGKGETHGDPAAHGCFYERVQLLSQTTFAPNSRSQACPWHVLVSGVVRWCLGPFLCGQGPRVENRMCQELLSSKEGASSAGQTPPHPAFSLHMRRGTEMQHQRGGGGCFPPSHGGGWCLHP